VIINRRSNNYWAAERRWISGEHVEVVRERKAYLDQRLRERAQGVTTAGMPVYPRSDYRYTLDPRRRTDLAQASGGYEPYYRRQPGYRRQPYCREVGGYEGYLRRTGEVCWLD